MTEMNHKTSLDLSRFLEEERTNAETERHKLLTQIGALYNLESQRRWDRLQDNHSTICNDIASSGELLTGLTTHSRLDRCVTRQQQLTEELIDLRNNLIVRMGQDKKPEADHRQTTPLCPANSSLRAEGPTAKLRQSQRNT
ncbi:hypothetical protein BO94DRAFT_277758 [Aspergillus sclerotioniger CBS 115572]|uniref:Uncharacterized protein n=1 Tax=Aspergillus sclerotioniger CBS 115572 TaxID=1450535 RepID=A0A317X7E6_9EURO|nr:hypothetical protein BO94DRAFT_277758 [Aspergillus sclerotioniger CBS 115572]PWY94523.1 hypothetical protein BO94DRAFT_277758 [Aspergillus sclerotioniger CBS 115572]